ncbi:MAG: transglutaminase-like domain-containing protein [Bacteroidota bacterium]
MLAESELKALVVLLEDNDENVWQIAYSALSNSDIEQVDMLNQLLFEEVNTDEQRNRLEEVIENVKTGHLSNKLMQWKADGGKNLLEAITYITQFRYPDVTEHYLTEKLESLRLDAWLEFHYDLTSFEKVKILNYILFQLHGFRGNEANFLHPDNSFINRVLDTKTGNPISLSIIYMLVAQRLNVPVYGINLPRHFIMAYVENDETETLQNFGGKQEITENAEGEIKFYINAYNGGGVFNYEQLQKTLKEMQLEEKPEYINPCTNIDIVRRVLMNLYNSYIHMNMREALTINKIIQLYN